MALMPGAEHRLVQNCTKGGQAATYGVVMHIMEGTLSGTDSWFRNNSSQSSSHFGIGKKGEIWQWVDTADRAWAQMSGNSAWLSIEHEGKSGESLTAAQLSSSARVMAWMHTEHGIPLVVSDSVADRGIGWHGMGGAAWGGHTSCPGNPIRAQRPEIIRQAAALLKGNRDMTDEQVKKLLADVASVKSDMADVRKKVDSLESNLIHIGDIDSSTDPAKRTTHGAGWYLAHTLNILRRGEK